MHSNTRCDELNQSFCVSPKNINFLYNNTYMENVEQNEFSYLFFSSAFLSSLRKKWRHNMSTVSEDKNCKFSIEN